MSALPLIVLSAVLHAGWNLLARAQRAQGTFLRVTLLISLAGLPLALSGLPLAASGHLLFASVSGLTLFPPVVWGLLAVAGASQAVYFLGFTRAYQNGDFTVVYPLARSLPILALALIDVARLPSLLGWLGLPLVSPGCVAIPLNRLGDFRLARYWKRTTAWVAVTALGTVGYTTVDKISAELIPSGLLSAGRYQVFEYAASLAPLALLLWLLGGRPPPTALPERPRALALLALGRARRAGRLRRLLAGAVRLPALTLRELRARPAPIEHCHRRGRQRVPFP